MRLQALDLRVHLYWLQQARLSLWSADLEPKLALATVRKAATTAGGMVDNVHLIPIDLASVESVRACGDAYKALVPQLPRSCALTALVLNAGCLAVPWEPAAQTPSLLCH